MIRKVEKNDIDECVKVIRDSFMTVANEFGFTAENAPRFTAFATTEDRLNWQLYHENRPMYAFVEDDRIVGYYSLLMQDNGMKIWALCTQVQRNLISFPLPVGIWRNHYEFIW